MYFSFEDLTHFFLRVFSDFFYHLSFFSKYNFFIPRFIYQNFLFNPNHSSKDSKYPDLTNDDQPVVGVTLPLMSYGGSSLITQFIAIGLCMNAAIWQDK